MQITVACKTECSENALKAVDEALSCIPTRIDQQLIELGLRIILVPNMMEFCPVLKELTEEELNQFDKNCPAVYAPLEKTIYLAEKWNGYESLTLMQNLLNRCGYAHGRLTGLASSLEFKQAISKDLNHAPADLQIEYRELSGSPYELYAVLFSLHITLKSGKNSDAWYESFAKIFPCSLKFIADEFMAISLT